MNTEYFNRITDVYGLGVDEFLDLFAAQGHACTICKHQLVLFSSNKREKPVVDHDHSTGMVRGILCVSCNIAVGWIEKRPKTRWTVFNHLHNQNIGIQVSGGHGERKVKS